MCGNRYRDKNGAIESHVDEDRDHARNQPGVGDGCGRRHHTGRGGGLVVEIKLHAIHQHQQNGASDPQGETDPGDDCQPPARLGQGMQRLQTARGVQRRSEQLLGVTE